MPANKSSLVKPTNTNSAPCSARNHKRKQQYGGSQASQKSGCPASWPTAASSCRGGVHGGQLDGGQLHALAPHSVGNLHRVVGPLHNAGAGEVACGSMRSTAEGSRRVWRKGDTSGPWASWQERLSKLSARLGCCPARIGPGRAAACAPRSRSHPWHPPPPWPAAPSSCSR